MRIGNVEYEKKGEVAVLTLDDPGVLNALSPGIREGLVKSFEDFERDENLRVAIVTGKGRAFCVGADIRGLKLDTAHVKETLRDIFRAMRAPEECSKPVIAAVNGLCLGGGLELAISCDIIIASEKAQFGVPEINLGLMPGFAIVRLHSIIGRAKAKEMMFTGEPISAEEAYRVGLVNKVVPHDKLMDEAMSLAKKIAEKPPLAIKVGKAAVNREFGGEDITYAIESMAFLFCTEDAKEGISAFLEKRKPEFKGR